MIKHNGKIMVLYDTLLRSLVREYHCSIWTFSLHLQDGRLGSNWYRSRERITATETANKQVHSHSSNCPFLMFTSISPYIAYSFSLKMETAGSSKHLYPSTKLLGITTHRTTLWILTTVRTWTSCS
jgi:hypothetical protein